MAGPAVEADTAAAARPRIPAFDHLRGYFVALIIVTHLYLMPNVIEIVTGRGALPASAAEGFCAISGIILGYVFLPRVRRSGLRAVSVRLLRRAFVIYLGAVALTGIRLMFASRRGEPIGFGTLLDALVLRTAGGVEPDFLALYAVLVLVSPLVLWAALHRREWIPITITGASWTFAQFLPDLDDADQMRLSWTFLFVLGMTIGIRWPQLQQFVRAISPQLRRTIGHAIVAVFVVTALAAEFLIFWNHHLLVALADSQGAVSVEALRAIERWFLSEWEWFGPLQEKSNLAPARLAIGTFWLTALFLVFRRFGPAIDRALGGLLSTFGRHALEAYVAHRLVIELVIAPTIWPWIAARDDVLLNTVAVVMTEVVVLVCVRAWVAVRRSTKARSGRGEPASPADDVFASRGADAVIP